MSQHTEAIRIVCFGGGSGLPELLRGLKLLRQQMLLDITAVVTMFDSGGSSGFLRREYDVLPSGDLRRCLEALSRLPSEELRILGKRVEINGVEHTLANLMLAEMEKLSGWRDDEKYELALGKLAKAMEVEGTVLPVSTQGNILSGTGENVGSADLCAEFSDGVPWKGEQFIDEHMNRGNGITKLSLDPPVAASLSVILAINRADYICIGPGSLYTSVVASLLPSGVKPAIRKSKAKIIYFSNLMTEGQGMPAMLKSSVQFVEEYTGRPVDYIVANTTKPSDEALEAYRAQNKVPLLVSPELRADPRYHFARLWFMPADRRIAEDPQSIRHDARRLAVMVRRIMRL